MIYLTSVTHIFVFHTKFHIWQIWGFGWMFKLIPLSIWEGVKEWGWKGFLMYLKSKLMIVVWSLLSHATKSVWVFVRKSKCQGWSIHYKLKINPTCSCLVWRKVGNLFAFFNLSLRFSCNRFCHPSQDNTWKCCVTCFCIIFWAWKLW